MQPNFLLTGQVYPMLMSKYPMLMKWRGTKQAPILHRISREHYAMHATQLFIDRSGVPHAHAKCTPCRKSTLFKLIVNFFLKSVVFMFWYDIVYIEWLYCVTSSELVLTWNKVAAVENAKKCRLYPPSPTLRCFYSRRISLKTAWEIISKNVWPIRKQHTDFRKLVRKNFLKITLANATCFQWDLENDVKARQTNEN